MADDKNAKPDAEVSDKEAAALQGTAGPNLTPAFGKKPMADENEPLVDEAELESIKKGSAAGSGPKEGSTLADALATGGVEPAEDNRVTYVSTGIQRLKLGKYEFENGRLILSPDEAADFDEKLEKAHPRTRNSVKKVDAAAGEKFARQFKAQNPSLVRGGDHSDTGSQSPAPSES